jgi:putative ABC transport system permease protein
MAIRPRVPLAWLNLVSDRRGLATAIAGIAFAVLLMFMMTGFRNAMFDSQVELIRLFDADLIIAARDKETLFVAQPFPRQRLRQALGCEGVEGGSPVYLESVKLRWKDLEHHSEHTIRAIGFDPVEPVFLDPQIRRGAAALKELDTVLFDTKARPVYGRVGPGTKAELADRVVRVVGTFEMGPDFVIDGSVLMSDRNFANFLSDPRSPRGRLAAVDIGLVRLTPGADLETVRSTLRRLLPGDVVVYTKPEFIKLEMRFWGRTTPIGYVFDLATGVGFAVGIVIAYQIIFTSVAANYKQYATLKAIGYSNGYLVRAVLQQSLLLALLGFGPGLVLSAVIFRSIARYGSLLMRLTAPRAGLILALTTVMCLISGAIAIRKILSSHPAEVFG